MSSTRNTRQRTRNNDQNPGQDDSSDRTNERAQVDESLEDNTEAREQHGDNYVTPSASFIGGSNREENAEISADVLEDLGWKIYTFEEKKMKMKLHFDFLNTCLGEGIIPKGLMIDKPSAIGAEDKTFSDKWKGILRDCSLKLMECLVEHYERELAQSAAKIAETYESLEKMENWTDNDKSQLEEEIHSILEPKEKQLKEEKQKKLETARNKKTEQRIRQPGRGTYADVLKKHIRDKLNPKENNESTSDPRQRRETQREKQPFYQTKGNGRWNYNPPYNRRNNRRTGRNEYNTRQQPSYRQQQEGRRQRPQGRYFLTRGPNSRSRYKD